jgi:hypothetical protein
VPRPFFSVILVLPQAWYELVAQRCDVSHRILTGPYR